jgi:2,4-dienoyl-CoA reductase-like NADH-dependent reductase (Old Yellow Enzyme family)
MRKVFEVTRTNGMTLKNRPMCSATGEESARPTPNRAECCANLITGGMDLIISG